MPIETRRVTRRRAALAALTTLLALALGWATPLAAHAATPEGVDDAYTVGDLVWLEVPAPGVLGNDSDADAGDTLSAVLESAASHGSMSLSIDGTLRYRSLPGFVGVDDFTYRVTDGTTSDLVTVTVTVTNGAPVAVGESFSTTTGVAVTGAAPGLLLNDSDPDLGDTLSAVLVNPAAHGSVSLLIDGAFGYTSLPGFVGIDDFTYRVTDGTASSELATVTIRVFAPVVTEPPVSGDDAYSTTAGIPLAIPAPGVLGNDTDADDDDLTAAVLTAPTHGVLVLGADGSIAYTPDPGHTGADSFTYYASDGTTPGNIATVTLTTLPAAPAVDDSAPTELAATGDEVAPTMTVVGGILVLGGVALAGLALAAPRVRAVRRASGALRAP